MDYEKKYKETLKKIENLRGYSLECNNMIDELFPELKESEDEKIRKALIHALKNLDKDHYNMIYLDGFSIQQCLAWLEKQGEKHIDGKLSNLLNRVICRFINDPYIPCSERDEVSNKIIPYVEQLEKQCDTNETIDRDKFAQGVLRGAAINLITWIDYNIAKGNMCLSNMECEDIENALVSGNWDKIYAYIKKKLEKQSKQNSTDSYCQDNCNGFQETGKCFADGECKAKIDEKHKVGKYFTGLIPCWVNAPSTLQPAHNYHGKNLVAIHLKDGGYRCCCIDDNKPITFTLPENTQLVEGWKRKSVEWSEEDEKIIETMCKEGDLRPSQKIWLKSIKDRVQPQWKPTDEQMNCFKQAIDLFKMKVNDDLVLQNLHSLYNNLEKP